LNDIRSPSVSHYCITSPVLFVVDSSRYILLNNILLLSLSSLRFFWLSSKVFYPSSQLQQSVSLLKEENEKLKPSIRSHLGNDKAASLLQEKQDMSVDGLLASSQGIANKVLDDPDFSFIKALQTAQQNFVVTDPSLPDNPIVYASQGFLNLTGYSLDQILGRNCRFLQGPETDPKHVERIRKAIEQGNDMSVCLLNYRVDGTTFWNQFFIAALRDAAGNVTNFVGVQCKVSDQYAATVTKQQEEEEAALYADAE
jgi:PAS domain S-box-containing protein